jgi:GxxExxY protein
MDSRELTYRIQGCIFEVSRHLGGGFLEKVYQQSLLKELQRAGLQAVAEKPVSVFYKGEVVGDYRADIIVNDTVLLEIKAQASLPVTAAPQLLNYLKATGLKIGLLVNFTHPKATVKRYVM